MERPKNMFGRWRRRERIEEDAVNKNDVRGKVVKIKKAAERFFYRVKKSPF